MPASGDIDVGGFTSFTPAYALIVLKRVVGDLNHAVLRRTHERTAVHATPVGNGDIANP